MSAQSPRGRWPRRQFMQIMATGLACGGAVGCGSDDAPPREPPPPEAREYRNAVEASFDNERDFDNAAFIGEYYVESRGATTTEAFDATARTRELIDAADSTSDAVERLEKQVHEDFVDAHLRALDGWTLSRTEVELCVLAYLVRNLE